MARFMFFIRFLPITAGTPDGPGQSYEETRETIYQCKFSDHHQLQFASWLCQDRNTGSNSGSPNQRRSMRSLLVRIR